MSERIISLRPSSSSGSRPEAPKPPARATTASGTRSLLPHQSSENATTTPEEKRLLLSPSHLSPSAPDNRSPLPSSPGRRSPLQPSQPPSTSPGRASPAPSASGRRSPLGVTTQRSSRSLVKKSPHPGRKSLTSLGSRKSVRLRTPTSPGSPKDKSLLNQNSQKKDGTSPRKKSGFALPHHDLQDSVPYLECKEKVKKEMDEKVKERDEKRRADLAAAVQRCFEESQLTGTVVITKKSALGDEGIPLVATQLETFDGISRLSICHHGIGPLGAQELAQALRLTTTLKYLNLSNNAIESTGAEMLASALCKLDTLETLMLSDNGIGPSFPRGLCKCTSLTELHLQHNQMTDLDTEISLHPFLKHLELAGNPFKASCKRLLTMDTESVLEVMLDGVLSTTNTKCNEVGIDNPDGTRVMFPIYELGVDLPSRWNARPGVLAELLKKYTDLKTLNGLAEWPVPPLVPLDTWDLSDKLLNAEYECVFIGNRLSLPNTITTLKMNNTNFCGQGAIALAECVKVAQHLIELQIMKCQWNDTVTAAANSVANRKTLTALNGLALLEEETVWDLRGELNDRVEIFYVARMIIDRKQTLTALDLRENEFVPMEAARITGAIQQASALTSLNGLAPLDEETTWDLRKRLLDGRLVNLDRETNYASMVSSTQFMASIRAGPGFTSLRHLKKKTIGTLPFELCFLQNRMTTHPGVLELTLAENGLGDVRLKQMSDFFLGAGRTLEVLHLNNNGIGREGGELLGKLLGQMELIKTLRLNDNPLGWQGVEAVCNGLGAHNPVKIQALYMNNTQLGPILPSNLSTLQSLQIFSVKDNGISVLSVDLCKMKQLTGLWVEGNAIEIPPAHVVEKGLPAIQEFLTLPDPPKKSRLLQTAAGGDILTRSDLLSRWSLVRNVFRPGLASTVAAFRMGKKQHAMKVQAHLQRHGNAIKAVRFHPALSLVVTCSADESVKLWEPNEFSEAKEWTCAHSLRGHKDTVYAVAFPPAHQPLLLASASRDKTIILWTPHQEAGQAAVWMCGQVLGGRLGRGEVKDGKKQHTAAVRTIEFFPDIHKTGKVMLASGADDDTVRIWSKEDKKAGEGEHWRETHRARKEGEEKVVRDESHYTDAEMLPIQDLFNSFSAGQAAELDDEEQLVVKEKKGKKWLEKRMGNVGKRANSMDMFELMNCCDMLGISQWVNKSTITRLFREVNRHVKSDDEVHELDFIEFCELLYWMGRKAQRQTEGEEVTEGPLMWNRYGNLESILGVKIQRLHKFEDDNLEDDDPMKRDMGWDCMFTLRGHAGPISSLAWLPTEDVVLASGSHDESVMLWHYTESRGRGTWTNVFRGVGHDSVVHRMTVGAYLGDAATRRGKDRVYLASSSADNTIMLWKISVRPIMRETLDGKVVGNAYSLIKGDRVTPGSEAVFTCCMFRPDGAVLVTGLSDGFLYFWSENSDGIWQCTTTLLCHTAPVSAVAFGGRQQRTLLLTGSDDCRCCLIDTEPFAEWITKKSRRASISGRRKSLSKVQICASSMELPPRTESQTFTKRLAAEWTLKMDFNALQRISQRLESSVARKELLLTPNHGGTLSMRCQPGSGRHDIRLAFQPNTVWFRTRFCVSAANVEAMEECHFADLHVVGPVISLTPRSTMFRKPVKIAVPHNAASIGGLVLMQCPFPTDSTCNWTPVDDVTFTATHACAWLESFTCFFVVVHRGHHDIPQDVVFCIPQTTDGRPLQHLHVSAGEHWLGQIEVVACASVQRDMAVSACFQSDFANAPLHCITRGTSIAHLSAHPFAQHRKVIVHSHCIAPVTWSGLHAIVPVEVRVTPGGPEVQSLNRSSASSMRHDSPAPSVRSSKPRKASMEPLGSSTATTPTGSNPSSSKSHALASHPVSNLLLHPPPNLLGRAGEASVEERDMHWQGGAQSRLFTLEEDTLSEHPAEESSRAAASPEASLSSLPETSFSSVDSLASDASFTSPSRRIRSSPSLYHSSPEPLSARSTKQLSFFGTSLSKRPLTSSLPDLKNLMTTTRPERKSTDLPAEETMYVGLALRNEETEVVAMLSAFRLSILPQKLSVVLHPVPPAYSRANSAGSASRQSSIDGSTHGARSPPPNIIHHRTPPSSHGRRSPPEHQREGSSHGSSHSHGRISPPDGSRGGRAHSRPGTEETVASMRDRQVTVAVEVEDTAGGAELTLAEVRVRVAQGLKIVALDSGARWTWQALPKLRFLLDTKRVVRVEEEGTVLASEQLPSVGMVCAQEGDVGVW